MNALALEPLNERRSLRETVAEKLRAAIISGDLVEGQLYSAPVLGDALGVSATPVREAMMDLTREGLVETIKNKGFRVTGMTDTELENIAAIRLLIEPEATRLAAENHTKANIAKLKQMAKVIVDAAQADDIDGYLSADRAFHHELMTPCGNAELVDLATSYRMRTRQYGLKSLMRERKLTTMAAEHLQMVELMETGDSTALHALLIKHISHARGFWNVGDPNDEVKRKD